MEEENTRAVIGKNSFWELISKIIEKIGAVVFTIILARFLLPESFGAYSLTISVALIFIAAINYSVDRTMMKYVSDALGKKRKSLASAYFKYIFKKKVMFSLIASILLIILSYPLAVYVFKKPFLFPSLLISGAYIFVLALESSYESLFYVFKKVKGKAIKETFKQFFRISTILIIFLFIAKSYYVVGVIFGLILTSIFVLIFIRKYMEKSAFFIFKKEAKVKIDKKRVTGFFYYMLLISFIGTILSYTNVVLLGIFLPDSMYIGLYSSAIALIWGLTGMLNLSSVFLPVFTQIKEKNLEVGFNKILRYSLILTVPAAFGILALSRYIIFFIYGESYLEASIILSVMAFMIIEGVNGSIIFTLFSAKEKLKYFTKIIAYTFFMNITLSIILIKVILSYTNSQLLASTGAAVSALISNYFFFILLIIGLKRKIKIKIEYVNFVKPLIASLIMFFSILGLLNLVKDINLIFGIFLVFVGVIIYLLVLFAIKGACIEDIKTFIEILPATNLYKLRASVLDYGKIKEI
ncbi:MAG: oligosaccharide flippase family protein [Nanoarchaeota archaeon]|nr:oligosaccharide flippase family protein [Nanoarchaeota archaeon]